MSDVTIGTRIWRLRPMNSKLFRTLRRTGRRRHCLTFDALWTIVIDAIFIADSTGKIEFVNAAFEVVTGYTAQETKDGGLDLFINSNPDKNDEDHSLADSGKASWRKSEKRASTVGRFAPFAKMAAQLSSMWR